MAEWLLVSYRMGYIGRPGKKLANKINKIIAETRWGELFTEKVEI